MTYKYDFDTCYGILESYFGVSSETINMVLAINGSTIDTLEDILYIVSGYCFFEELEGGNLNYVFY